MVLWLPAQGVMLLLEARTKHQDVWRLYMAFIDLRSAGTNSMGDG
jgi:hypothetical protein